MSLKDDAKKELEKCGFKTIRTRAGNFICKKDNISYVVLEDSILTPAGKKNLRCWMMNITANAPTEIQHFPGIPVGKAKIKKVTILGETRLIKSLEDWII